MRLEDLVTSLQRKNPLAIFLNPHNTGAPELAPHVPPTYLLLQSHDLETLEVGQVLPLLTSLSPLDVRAVGPLLVDLVLLPQLLNGASTGGTGKLGDNERSEGGVRERENVTGDDLVLLARRTVDQNLQEVAIRVNTILAKSFKSSPKPARSRPPISSIEGNVRVCGQRSRQ